MFILDICVSLNFALVQFTIRYAEMDLEVLGNKENAVLHRPALRHGGVGALCVGSRLPSSIFPQSKAIRKLIVTLN